jgi:hypothetical protein
VLNKDAEERMERCVESPALEPPSETREAPETAAAPRQGLVLQKGDAHTTGYYVSYVQI